MKRCKKCKIEKEFSEFNNRSASPDGKRPRCKKCQSIDQFEYASKNRDKLKLKHKLYRQNNPDKITATRHKHYSNPENKDRNRKWAREYIQKRRKTNPLVNLIMRYRSRTRKVFKDTLGKKTVESLTNLLGCTPEQFKQYFESLFTPDMSWEAVFSGKIHIDHIIPISSATNEEELIKLSHYTNLQPLWDIENLKKSDR